MKTSSRFSDLAPLAAFALSVTIAVTIAPLASASTVVTASTSVTTSAAVTASASVMASAAVMASTVVTTSAAVESAPPGATAVSPETLRTWVEELCAPELEGRVVGSPGLARASEIVARRFARIGLTPAGPSESWFQSFRPEAPLTADAVILPPGARWGEIELVNVAGRLPGSGEGCVIVTAHYDHLGFTKDGALCPGADDNASGVAALCAIASELVKEPPHRRAIVFVATSGEEEGCLGARHYAGSPLCPLEQTFAVVNLDTVGRMQNDQLFALAAETAVEFGEILRGVNLGFGLDLVAPPKSPMASDQTVFLEKGIPGIHLFTGPNEDYHRPSDTPEKVNVEGLAKVAAFGAEVVRYLADREEPLSFVPPGAEKVATEPDARPRPARRVSLGTLPDFAYAGSGVQLNGTLPNSPADKAGLRKGDRIIAIDGDPVGDLEDFAAILRSHAAGDTLSVRFLRGGVEQTVRIELAERK